MQRMISLRTTFTVILLGAPLAGLVTSDAGAQGLTYDMKMTTVKGDGSTPGNGQIVMAGRGQFSNGNSRMDIDQSSTPGIMGKGVYIIVKNATRTEWIVDPDKRQVIEVNVDSAANLALSGINVMGGLVKMETSGDTVDLQPLGPGETIQGYATTKYRLTHGSTSTVSVLGRKKRTTSTTVSDMWIAPQLAGLVNPASGAMGQAGGSSAAAKKLAAAYARMGKGVPIKTVSHIQTSGDHASVMTSTMELLNIKPKRIDPSVFDVPAGYTKVDITAELNALTGNDSKGAPSGNIVNQMGDSAKQGMKQGATEAAKEGAKEKTKGVLRGIFRRP